jgi:DNA-binding NarL/FixJ family response regulator
MTRVFIADDHAIMRCGIKQVLRDLGGFDVVGEADDGRKVLSAPDIDRWDVLVLDLSLPKVNGPEVLRRLKARRPELPIVVLSMYPEEQYARRLLAAGAAAYLSKERPPADLVAAVRAAARGERQPTAEAATAPHASLTKREHQILMLLVEGHAVADIAAELDVHSCTVSNHLAKIRQKLGVGSVAEIVRHALSAGLVSADIPVDPE